MNQATWWKRLFLVLEIVTAIMGGVFFYMLTNGDHTSVIPMAVFSFGPCVLIGLTHAATVYIVEGLK